MSPLGIWVGGVKVCVILVLEVIFKMCLLSILFLFFFFLGLRLKT